MWRFAWFLLVSCPAGIAPGAVATQHSLRMFVYDRGQASAGDKLVRIHEASLPGVRGKVRVYATALALPANPVASGAGRIHGAQRIVVGQKIDGQFVPAVRFGTADSGRGPTKDMALISVWAGVGGIGSSCGGVSGGRRAR